MSENARGSITREAADLRSPDPIVRERAALWIWERFEPQLVDLVHRRLHPKIRVWADEQDIVQSMFKSFFAADRAGDRPLPPDRDALWQVFYSSPAVLAVSPFAMERQLYVLATHGATS